MLPAFLTRPVRFLPRGPLDALLQIGIVLAAYYAYRFSRGAIDDPLSASVAFSNADWIYRVEKALHLNFEHGAQTLAGNVWGLQDLTSFMYINAQTTVTFGAMAYIYARHNQAFGFVRNMFVVAWGLAILGYILMPTAPPRLVSGLGIHDNVAAFTGVDPSAPNVSKLYNPYAAVPSMHVGFALMVGVPLARLSKHKPVRIVWAIYPIFVTFVVLATGNHFFLDAVFGALAIGIAALVARRLGMIRPEAWRFGPVTRATA